MPAAPPKHRLVVLVRPGAAIGFRLAGVTVVEAAPGEEAAKLHEARVASQCGVVAADEDVLAAIPEHERAAKAPLPVVLPFALPRRWTEEGRGRAWVAALVRRAVGYHVKLGGEAR